MAGKADGSPFLLSDFGGFLLLKLHENGCRGLLALVHTHNCGHDFLFITT